MKQRLCCLDSTIAHSFTSGIKPPNSGTSGQTESGTFEEINQKPRIQGQSRDKSGTNQGCSATIEKGGQHYDEGGNR